MASDEMAEFFGKWGVSVRLSSAQYPQSNGRAEAAVKTAKRLIMANTGDGGNLDTDRMALALLQYLTTPLRGGDRSPAQLAAGRQLRDGVPTARWHLMVDRQWGWTLRRREVQMADSGEAREACSTPRRLPPLPLGTRVRVQNQASNLWDRTGLVVEARPHRQYAVRLDGSGRVSFRNRKHLRPSTAPDPARGNRPETEQASAQPPPPAATPSTAPTHDPSLQPPRPRRQTRRPAWMDGFA